MPVTKTRPLLRLLPLVSFSTLVNRFFSYALSALNEANPFSLLIVKYTDAKKASAEKAGKCYPE